MKKIFATLLLSIFSLSLAAQGLQSPAEWSVSVHRVSEREAELHLRASIAKPWIMYAANVPDDGPMPISVVLDEAGDYALAGELQELSKPKDKYDAMFEMVVPYFDREVLLAQRITLREGAEFSAAVQGYIEYQCCDDEVCLLFDHEFSVQPSADAPPVAATSRGGGRSLLKFFLLALLAGVAAVLTPCVFPMLPMTVSFFMRGQSRGRGLRKAFIFGTSIVLIYTAIGAIVAATKTADMTSVVSSHWLTNLLFFALFMMFAFSFFGAFSLRLPSAFVNRIDRQADKGGDFSAFFMALALSIISFSCTGPFVGALLVAAAGGEVLMPVVGMFGFSLAFATPFTVLAMFPAALKKLPKSGGWLNSVKICFAFILAMFSLKFLSTADQVLGFYLISRELFICIWVVLLVLLGAYLLGKIRFAHDDRVDHVGVPRFVLAAISLCFALHLFTGLVGNPLRSLSGFLPQYGVNSPAPTPTPRATGGTPCCAAADTHTHTHFHAPLCANAHKHSELRLAGPANLPSYFDLDEGLACAAQQGKNVLLAFKGHTCSNCKKMDGEVFTDPRVLNLLSENFVIVSLYLDEKTALPADEQYTSAFDNRLKRTIGEKNRDFLMTHYRVNAMPYFALLDSEGNTLGEPVGYVGVERFLEFLGQGE